MRLSPEQSQEPHSVSSARLMSNAPALAVESQHRSHNAFPWSQPYRVCQRASRSSGKGAYIQRAHLIQRLPQKGGLS
jgi:hypothetical protein